MGWLGHALVIRGGEGGLRTLLFEADLLVIRGGQPGDGVRLWIYTSYGYRASREV